MIYGKGHGLHIEIDEEHTSFKSVTYEWEAGGKKKETSGGN